MVPAHVTLLGPTILPTSPTVDSEIDRHLLVIARRCAPFAMQLHGTGTFRPISPVVFVALAAGIAECEGLATSLNSGPLARDLTYPYHPHVTVAHAVPEPAMDEVFDRLAGYAAMFTVAHFTRYEHSGDGQWKPIRDYPLAGG